MRANPVTLPVPAVEAPLSCMAIVERSALSPSALLFSLAVGSGGVAAGLLLSPFAFVGVAAPVFTSCFAISRCFRQACENQVRPLQQIHSSADHPFTLDSIPKPPRRAFAHLPPLRNQSSPDSSADNRSENRASSRWSVASLPPIQRRSPSLPSGWLKIALQFFTQLPYYREKSRKEQDLDLAIANSEKEPSPEAMAFFQKIEGEQLYRTEPERLISVIDRTLHRLGCHLPMEDQNRIKMMDAITPPAMLHIDVDSFRRWADCLKTFALEGFPPMVFRKKPKRLLIHLRQEGRIGEVLPYLTLPKEILARSVQVRDPLYHCSAILTYRAKKSRQSGELQQRYNLYFLRRGEWWRLSKEGVLEKICPEHTEKSIERALSQGVLYLFEPAPSLPT